MIAPTSRATRFAQSDSRNAAAPAPETSIFANEVSSKRAAASRQARCSAPVAGDQRRPAHPLRPQRLVAGGRVRLEPVGALPARLLAEGGAELGQACVGRRDSQRPPGLSLVAGVAHVVVGRVDLDRARERVGPRAVRRAEAARVHLPDVERRHPLGDPLRDELAHPARAREPVRAEARGDPEAAHVGGAEDELVVGRERLGPVDQLHDVHPLESGDAADRVLEQRLEPLPVLGEQLAVEVRRDPVERPGGRVALVAAHDQPARLGAEVDEQRRVAHRRHVGRQAGRLRDEVLVRHRDQRHVDARERPELLREHAARVDDHLCLDRPLVGDHADDATALDGDLRDAGVREDLGPAAPRALGEREGELRGVDVAVRGEEGSAEHTLGGHRREQPLRLLRRDQLEREAERLRPAGLAGKLLEPFRGGREPERADLAPAGLEVDLGAERAVQLDRAHHHLRQRERAAQLSHEACRVEGRARGEVGAVDEDGVRPAELGQPVEDRAAPDPASDHDDSRPVSHPGRL